MTFSIFDSVLSAFILFLAIFLSARKETWLGLFSLFLSTLALLGFLYIPSFFLKVFFIDAIAAIAMFLGTKDEHRNIEAVTKLIFHQTLSSLLLIVTIQSLSPSYFHTLILVVSVCLKLGLFPFSRAWVDFMDGSSKVQSVLIGLTYKVFWLTLLLDTSLLPEDVLYFSSLAGIVTSSILILAQSNMRRVQSYFSILVTSMLVLVATLDIEYPGSLAVLLLFISLLPKLRFNDRLVYIDFPRFITFEKWKQVLTIIGFLLPSFVGVYLIEKTFSFDGRSVASIAIILFFTSAILYRLAKAIRIVNSLPIKHHL